MIHDRELPWDRLDSRNALGVASWDDGDLAVFDCSGVLLLEKATPEAASRYVREHFMFKALAQPT